MELIDIIDENDKLLGYTEERNMAHEKGLWHRHVGCWIMNEKGEVLMEQRAFSKVKNPGKWCKPGGHVDAGEKPDEAIQREVYEEIGLKVEPKDVINIEIFKKEREHDNTFTYGYIFFTNKKEEDYVIQEEEVNAVKYFKIEDLEQYKKEGNENFTFYKWDIDSFNVQMNLLKEYREKIAKSN